MSQNKLLINERARNHIKIFPVEEGVFDDIPTDEGEKIRWCESQYKRLQSSIDAKRIFIDKHRGKGYLVSVWELDGRYYLIQCIRNEFKTFNTVIYVSKNKSDMLNIAKFLKQNVDQIMKDYKEQILEARAALVKNAIENPVVGEAEDKPNGNA